MFLVPDVDKFASTFKPSASLRVFKKSLYSRVGNVNDLKTTTATSRQLVILCFRTNVFTGWRDEVSGLRSYNFPLKQ